MRYELYKQEFMEMTILDFSCLVQILYDEDGVIEVPSVDVIVEVMDMPQTSMIKDLETWSLQRGHTCLR